MKEWALYYSSLGLSVFPLKARDKVPVTSTGFKVATMDTGQIERWWNECPNYNIGIATGAVSGGLFVIDLDIDEEKGKNGYEVLKDWQREHGELPETWQSITGRGGYHIFYKDASTIKNRANLYEGVDIRGDGGYIVAPPSVHPNGNRYEWELDPDSYKLADMNDLVFSFINPVKNSVQGSSFSVPTTIGEGERTATMVKMVCSMQAKGFSDEAIKTAVMAENNSKCVPPLTEQELEREVFPALKRYQKGTSPYDSSAKQKSAVVSRNASLSMTTMDTANEKSIDWLMQDYIPKGQITIMAGDGGSGKTSLWCKFAADVSCGELWGLTEDGFFFQGKERVPQKVMFFSAEDSFEYVLKRRLRKNGAILENIMSIDIADERFQLIKFDTPFLEQLIAEHKPALVIFDPVQAFVPADIRMGDRNAMRSCMAPLITLGEKYGCTFIVVVHANKQSGVWGRKRIADSADIWDIARSVLMVGETNENGIRYMSHEKSNYSMTADTVLFNINDEEVTIKGHSQKKDRDFIMEADYTTRQAPQKEEAKDFILDFLKDGEKEVSELDDMAKAQSISISTLKKAKGELKKEEKIKYRAESFGKNKGFKYFVSLTALNKEV